MNTAVVRPHRAGLFSNINKIITCLRMFDDVEIDWSRDSLYGNCWSDLFCYNAEQPIGTQVIYDFPFYDLTAQMAGVLYQCQGWGWRDRFHPYWEKLHVRPEPEEHVNSFLKDPTDYAGMLVRSDGHAGEQLFGRTQSLEEYADAFKATGHKNLFLVAGDKETISWFRNRFETTYYFNTKRVSHRSAPERHLTEPQTVEDAKQVLIEVLTLSKCQTLIHPVSNMSTTALIINPKMKSVYLP